MDDKMFTDNTDGKLAEMNKFALTHPNGETLAKCLERLAVIATNKNSAEVILYNDWAKMSLGWTMIDRQTDFPVLTGGLIFHGSIDDQKVHNGSVTMDSTDGWQLHT